jgi:alpha-L-fucosidase 2
MNLGRAFGRYEKKIITLLSFLLIILHMKIRSILLLIGITGYIVSYSQDPSLRLFYKQPAVKWTEALPIGNGRLGGMIFGGVARDHVQFNEETLWTGEPRDYNRPGASSYLATIRQLLFDGKQKEAEALAQEKFMGMQSGEGKKKAWLKEIRAMKGLPADPSKAGFDDGHWKEITVPTFDGWESAGLPGLDGAVWFRTTFDVPGQLLNKELVLDLGRIRNQDFTYINGALAGSMESAEPRKYTIPAGTLKKGNNTIAIQVINYSDKGGITGYKDTSRHIAIYPKDGNASNGISLVKQWKYYIQDDEPPAVPQYEADYQPFGDLWIDSRNQQAPTSYRRELDISNAISKTSYSINSVTYTREYFASEPGQTMMIHFTASKTGSLNFEASLTSPHKYASVKKLNSNTLALSVQVRNGIMKGESYLQVVPRGGETVVTGDRIVVTRADEVTLYLTAGTNFKNYNDASGDPAAACVRALNSIQGKTYEQVKAEHIKEYQSYFNTFSIKLGDPVNNSVPTDERIEKFASSPDPSFAALYVQYGRYLLISSSRPGTQPANLQGIWNDQMVPPWGSKYTTNINTEMNYWPAELLNLSPMHEPLFKMIEDLAVTGGKTAKVYYNAPGWVLHHNTDLWRGSAPINASNHGIWVSGSGWLSHHLWEHYLFTQDKNFLQKRAYPLMKQAALFYNSFLIKDPKTGWLISSPSNSPENGGLVAGPTMDHQIIRDLFRNVIKASEILQVDKPLRDSLLYKVAHIAPNQVGRYGQLQEWLQDVDDSSSKHRHVSHLWGIYPGSEINYDETPELMKAAKQSLIFRGDEATGWSLAWKINFWARFKDGEHSFKMVKILLSPAEKNGEGSYRNLFDAHPPFQIDGNFGGAAGIAEMLLQSHTKYIDLLPALPTELPDGEVKGICARGGFVLNIKWQHGLLQQVDIVSTTGNDCLFRYAGKELKVTTRKGGVYRFDGGLKSVR